MGGAAKGYNQLPKSPRASREPRDSRDGEAMVMDGQRGLAGHTVPRSADRINQVARSGPILNLARSDVFSTLSIHALPCDLELL